MEDATRIVRTGTASVRSWSPTFEDSLCRIAFRGICYATPERANCLYDLPMSAANHLTVVQDIKMASTIAARNQYDFILMAGPPAGQLDDVVAIIKAVHKSGQSIPQMYIHGPIHPDLHDLLPLFAPKYGLREVYKAETGRLLQHLVN